MVTEEVWLPVTSFAVRVTFAGSKFRSGKSTIAVIVWAVSFEARRGRWTLVLATTFCSVQLLYLTNVSDAVTVAAVRRRIHHDWTGGGGWIGDGVHAVGGGCTRSTVGVRLLSVFAVKVLAVMVRWHPSVVIRVRVSWRDVTMRMVGLGRMSTLTDHHLVAW